MLTEILTQLASWHAKDILKDKMLLCFSMNTHCYTGNEHNLV